MSNYAFNAAAESLYGGTSTPVPLTPAPAAQAPVPVSKGLYSDTPEPAPDAGPTPTKAEVNQQALADALYDKPVTVIAPNLPPGIAELRAGEENGPYSRIGGYNSVALEASMEGLDFPAETLAAAAKEYRHMAADLGADANQASQFLATVQGLRANPPTPEQSAKMQTDAAALVVAKYGDDAPKMLDLAKRLVQRDPRAQQLLDRSGAGNDPRTVMSIIELAVQQRTRGRLK